MVDEPGFEFGIRPRVVNLVRGIVVIFLHLLDEVVMILLVIRLDQPLAEEPPALQSSWYERECDEWLGNIRCMSQTRLARRGRRPRRNAPSSTSGTDPSFSERQT